MRRLIVVLVSAFLGYFIAPTVAQAAFGKMHASFCQGVDKDTYYYYGVDRGLQSGGGPNNFICPWFEDSSYSRTAITYIHVHGYDAQTNDEVKVAACVKYYGIAGGQCGTEASSGIGKSGHFSIYPDIQPWVENFFDFAYLRVRLCTDCGLFGYAAGN